MAYQQYQPQRQGIGQGLQQTGFPQQAQFQQPSSQFSTAPQGGLSSGTPVVSAAQQSLPTAQQAPPTAQQTSQTPQSAYGTPQATQQSFGQQVPAPQLPAATAQQPAGSLQQGGQFGTTLQSVPQQSQIPQTGFAQTPQQATGQPIPSQTAQSGMQVSGQSGGFGVTASGQMSPGPSLAPGAQSIASQTGEAGAGQQTGEQAQQELVGTPSIDVVDMPDEIVLFVDLPGFEEEDIRIQADGQNLNISAERRDEDEQQEGQKFARERPKKLQRTVRLPSRADVNEADATYENGVCKITLPKMEEEKQHEIAFQ